MSVCLGPRRKSQRSSRLFNDEMWCWSLRCIYNVSWKFDINGVEAKPSASEILSRVWLMGPKRSCCQSSSSWKSNQTHESNCSDSTTSGSTRLLLSSDITGRLQRASWLRPSWSHVSFSEDQSGSAPEETHFLNPISGWTNQCWSRVLLLISSSDWLSECFEQHEAVPICGNERLPSQSWAGDQEIRWSHQARQIEPIRNRWSMM